MRHAVAAVAAILLLARASCPWASPVLNEVLYDPAGADAGKEFVELFNPGAAAVSLAGSRLEFANGADDPPVWTVRWAGTEGDSIAPAGFFLLADTGWSGPPAAQAVLSLALQNGPDAVRLVLPGSGAQDRLGYGALTAPELYETAPHPGARAGESLARRPDGRDSDDNAADWVALAAPTPGAENFAARAVTVDAFAPEPPSLPAVGSPVALILRVANCGLLALPGGVARLRAEPALGAAPVAPESVSVWLDPLEPGEARVLRAAWTPGAEGRRRLELVVPGDACGPPLRGVIGEYQVGPAGPFLSELMAAPSAGACEWVEIGNAGPAPLELGTLSWRDEDGGWRSLPQRWLAPGELIVLAQDRPRYLDWWRKLVADGAPTPCGAVIPEQQCLEPSGSWPSLNNTPPADRDFADRLYLGDSAGAVLDHVTLGGGGEAVPAGRSLERAHLRPRGAPERNWGPSSAPCGATPACGNALSLAIAPGAELTLRPNPFVPAAGAVLHVQFTLSAGERGWDARIFDLWGRRVRDLGGDGLGAGPRDVIWDGRDDGGAPVAAGGYVVLVRRHDAGGGVSGGERRLAVIAGAGGAAP